MTVSPTPAFKGKRSQADDLLPHPGLVVAVGEPGALPGHGGQAEPTQPGNKYDDHYFPIFQHEMK